MEQRINDIVRAVYKELKSLKDRPEKYTGNFIFDNWEKSIPKINPIYEKTIKHHYEVAVHAKKDQFPFELLRSKAPNQTQQEWDFQRGIYQPYTRSTWGRALNKTKIITNAQNYSITGWDEEQKKYFFTDYPAYHSLVSFFFDVYREEKVNYPNKLMVIEPSYIPGNYVQDENGNAVFVIDDTQLIEPIVRIVDEKEIVYHRANELSIVINGHKRVGENNYPTFKSFDRANIYLSEPVSVDEKNNAVYETRVMYRHDWGYVPARKLGGRPSVMDGDIFYESYFASAIPDLNRALMLASNLDMASFANLFPIRIVRVDECDYISESGQSCTNGKVFNSNKQVGDIIGGWETCNKCGGTGKANTHSPTGVYAVPTSKGIDNSTVIGVNDVIAYAAPGVDVYKHLSETIEACKANAFSFLVKEKDSASPTVDDALNTREEAHAFLMQFSNELYNDLELAVEAIGFMRYGSEFVMPSISRPVSFTAKTSADITAEIGEAVKNKMPSSYIQQLLLESAVIRFNNNEDARQYIELSMKLNPLWSEDITSIRSTLGVSVEPIDLMVYQRITHYLDLAFNEHEDFIKLDFDRQNEIVRGYAAADLEAFVKPASPLSIENLLV